MPKFKDYSGQYERCYEAAKHCAFGGWCTSCMYRYPGNFIIENLPEDYKEYCEISPLPKKEESHEEVS